MNSSRASGAVDRRRRDQPVGDQRDAVQGDALVGHHRGALAGPVRLGVGPLDQVRAEPLGPLRLDRGVDPRVEPRGLDELGRHHQRRLLPEQPRPREDREPGVAGAEVVALVGVAQADVGQQPGQQRLVDAVLVDASPSSGRCPGGRARRDPSCFAVLAQLGLQVLPLPDAQVVEVLGPAHPAERARAQLALLGAHVAPQVQQREEVRACVLEARVLLVGLGLLVDRALARVLHRQRRGDREHLAEHAQPCGLEDHPGQPRVDRKRRELAPGPREPSRLLASGSPLAARAPSSSSSWTPAVDLAPVRRVDEREPRDVAEPERGHLQDHRGEVGAQDLRVGELRTAGVVLLGVEPDGDAGLDAAAAAGPLVRRGLADRLDREPLDLGAEGVARDRGRPRCRRRSGCPGRSARSRRRWSPARSGGAGAARRPGAARRRRAARRAARRRHRLRSRAPATPARGRRRCRGSPARRGGRRGCRPAPRRPAPGRPRRSPRSGRGRRARPPRRRRTPRPAAGSGPRPGRSAPRPPRSAPAARCRSAKCAANRSGSIVAEVMTTLRSGRRGSSRLR